MDPHQQPPSVLDSPPAQRGALGTKIPSTVCFTIGILLFLLPFAELKCKSFNETAIPGTREKIHSASLSNTGMGLAFGSEWKFSMNNNLYKGAQNYSRSRTTEPNIYAIIALGLAVIGLGLSFANTRSALMLSAVTGFLSACSLVGLMLDLKKELKNEINKATMFLEEEPDLPFVLGFTPWFYIAIVVFFAAAILSFTRLRSL